MGPTLHRTTKPQPARCPECGGVLNIILDGLVGRLMAPSFFTLGKSRVETVMAPAPFVACSACEFCEEVGRGR